MSPPRFTIITVCLNAGEALSETLQSVLLQDCEDWEYLIKDGGSTDGSLDQVPDDPRIRIDTSPENGIYDAMNVAASQARGDYLNFLNAGDRFPDSDVLSRVAAAVDSADCPELIYGDYFDERSAKVRVAGPDFSRRSLYFNGLCHQAQWIRRETFAKAGGLDLSYRFRADHELLLRLAESGVEATYLPKVLALYDGQGFSARKGNRKSLDEEWTRLRRTRYKSSERFKWGFRAMLRFLWLKRLILDVALRWFPGLLKRRAEKSS